MPTVLSTKKLALNQRELLLNSGIGLVEYDAISTEIIEFRLENKHIENAIFTSKNAVKAIDGKELKINNSFCVGEKTAFLLERKGFQILEKADSARELALRIVENHSEKEFYFFCGNKRREELPEFLETKGIPFNEISVYKTTLNPQRFESEFDGILFFSPSAVQSFTQKNKLNTTAFCIGKTTADEAKKHTDNIVIASTPSIENVIAKLVSTLKNK